MVCYSEPCRIRFPGTVTTLGCTSFQGGFSSLVLLPHGEQVPLIFLSLPFPVSSPVSVDMQCLHVLCELIPRHGLEVFDNEMQSSFITKTQLLSCRRKKRRKKKILWQPVVTRKHVNPVLIKEFAPAPGWAAPRGLICPQCSQVQMEK